MNNGMRKGQSVYVRGIEGLGQYDGNLLGQAQPSKGIALAPYTLTLPSRIGQAAHLLRRHRKRPGLYQMWVVSGVGVESLARPEASHHSRGVGGYGRGPGGMQIGVRPRPKIDVPGP